MYNLKKKIFFHHIFSIKYNILNNIKYNQMKFYLTNYTYNYIYITNNKNLILDSTCENTIDKLEACIGQSWIFNAF